MHSDRLRPPPPPPRNTPLCTADSSAGGRADLMPRDLGVWRDDTQVGWGPVLEDRESQKVGRVAWS